MATIVLEGHLTDVLVLRFSEAGKPWATGRVMENQRRRDGDGNYTALRSLAFNFVVFGRMAENAVESFETGARVRIEGELEPDDYTKDDTTVESTRIVVNSITASIRYAVATMTKNPKSESGQTAAGDEASPVSDAPTSTVK